MATEVERKQRVEKFRKNLTNLSIETYCVMLENEMIGFLTIHKNDGEIWAIYLVEKFCGKGYGKKLLDFEIAELKNMGHDKIFLWVFEDNMRARRFYEKHGFYSVGVKREMTYGKPLVQVRYVLNL